jgi:hypothetical protein
MRQRIAAQAVVTSDAELRQRMGLDTPSPRTLEATEGEWNTNESATQ